VSWTVIIVIVVIVIVITIAHTGAGVVKQIIEQTDTAADHNGQNKHQSNDGDPQTSNQAFV
jgi:hypothetical protein